jgi:conjugative transposon TraM protein
MQKINFKQKKYVFALITLPFALYVGYNISQYTGEEEVAKVEEISTNLGSSEDVEDIQDKSQAYDNAYQLQKDQGTALSNIDKENDSLAFYNDNMTPAQRRQMDSLEAIRKMRRDLDRTKMASDRVQKSYFNPNNNTGRSFAEDTRKRDDEDYNKSLKLLEAINSNGQKEVSNRKSRAEKEAEKAESPEQWRDQQLKLMRQQMMFADSLEKSKDPEFQQQALLSKQNADNEKKKKFYMNSTLPVTKGNKINQFNSFSRDQNDSFIKAVIDENIKGYMGSRLKLRLLDDIYIGNLMIQKGTPLFALITGFDSQRVKLSIVSVLYKNQILPIALDVFDVDGMEGLYVPSSAFREMTKDMGVNVVQGQQLNSQSQDFYSTMLTSVYKSSSQAIASILRKNKAKLKYNTHIYLIDKKELDKKRQEIYKEK